MMRVGFAGTFASRLEAPVRARLDVPCEIVVADEDAIVSKLGDVDVLVTLAFTRAMAAAARRLKLVQVPGAGLDRIDVDALPAGARLANAYGHETGIAEYVIGAMLALGRELARVDAALRSGRWESQWAPQSTPRALWSELAGKTLGIVGHGRIGGALARRARAFDMEVLAIRRHPSGTADDGVATVRGPEAMDDLLRRSDYVALTLPLTPDTRGLIGAAQLGLMKRSAILINVARAHLVDEDALYDALAQGRIAGAALDVWYRYPTDAAPTLPAHRPFHELPNVLMTPHVAGWTDGMLEARATLIAENIRRTAGGEPPLNAISG